MSQALSLPSSAGAGIVRLGQVRAHRWRPGLEAASFNEVLGSSDEASGAGAALALALDDMHLRERQRAARGEGEDRRAILWVQDQSSIRLNGRPCRAGLPAKLQERLIHVAAKTPQDALFALEEGLRCRDFACVIGEVAGNPKALDFTASRRLSLVAERHGIRLWLVRHDAARDLSAARMRWQVHAARSPASRWNAQAPGAPSWRAELFRARAHIEGEWILTLHDPLPHRGRGYEDLRACSPVEVGEGGSALEVPNTPLQAMLAPGGASCAILSPRGERASA